MKLSTGILSRLLLWQKLLIVGIIAAIAAAIPLGFYIYETQQDAAKVEYAGKALPPIDKASLVGRQMRAHRHLATLYLAGAASSAKELSDKQNEIKGSIEATDPLIQAIPDKKINDDWADIKKDWAAILAKVSEGKTKADDIFSEHNALIQAMTNLTEEIGDYYGLTYVSRPDLYFLGQLTVRQTRRVNNIINQLKTVGARMLMAKQATPEQLTEASTLLSNMKQQRLSTAHSVEMMFQYNPEIKAKLEGLTNEAREALKESTALLQDEILNKTGQLNYSPAAYMDSFAKTEAAYNERNSAARDVMNDLFGRYIEQVRYRQIAVIAGIVVLFIVAVVFGLIMVRSITNPLNHLVEVMNKLASGDSSVRANPETFDEIGLMGRQFDIMVDQREAVSAAIQKENEQLNTSVIDLLQAVFKLSQRDLTVSVPVTEDITGPVADALNQLTNETAKVLNRVVHIAGDVAKVSQQVKAQSDNVIGIASEEKRQVEQAATELSKASEVMLDIAKLALTCNEAAEKAIKNTDKAQETVLGTVQGITTIRDTIRETEKRIKRLGERSQEIGGVVNIINNIAERTHTLALNASMHAASAGEAGRGFAVVANEVQKLAENAREATSQISALVNNIQVETADTVTTMNDAISQVVRGTTLAQQAGSEMRETRDTTANLVQLVQRIADNSKVQAETSLRLRDTAKQIQQSSEQTYEELQNQGKQTERLVGFSGGLVESVSVFTLPKVEKEAA